MIARARPETIADTKLAKALRKGRRSAWREFYAQYAESLFRFVLARVRYVKETAEDITHDSIVSAIESIKNYDPVKGSLWNWLCGIAMNKIRENARAEIKSSQLSEQLQSAVAAAPAEPADEDTLEATMLIVSNLSPEYQEVLVNKYMKGMSVRELAGTIGVSEKAVESRLTRARDAFRKEFDKMNSAPIRETDG